MLPTALRSDDNTSMTLYFGCSQLQQDASLENTHE